jgi:hypothetical protein
VVTIGRAADAGEVKQHDVTFDNQSPALVAGWPGLDRLGQRLGQLPPGLEGTFMTSEPVDELPKPRHWLGRRAGRGELLRRESLEFRP